MLILPQKCQCYKVVDLFYHNDNNCYYYYKTQSEKVSKPQAKTKSNKDFGKSKGYLLTNNFRCNLILTLELPVCKFFVVVVHGVPFTGQDCKLASALICVAETTEK